MNRFDKMLASFLVASLIGLLLLKWIDLQSPTPSGVYRTCRAWGPAQIVVLRDGQKTGTAKLQWCERYGPDTSAAP